MSSVVYTLELEGGKYYVGSTHDLPTRMAQHFLGRGSMWTKAHRPIRIAQVVEGGREMEDAVTIAVMARRGWRNVRGGSWCSLELPGMPDPLARAYAKPPVRQPKEADGREIFDWGGQAVAVTQTGDSWQAKVTGPLAILYGPSSGVVLLKAETMEEAREGAVQWVAARSFEAEEGGEGERGACSGGGP